MLGGGPDDAEDIIAPGASIGGRIPIKYFIETLPSLLEKSDVIIYFSFWILGNNSPKISQGPFYGLMRLERRTKGASR